MWRNSTIKKSMVTRYQKSSKQFQETLISDFRAIRTNSKLHLAQCYTLTHLFKNRKCPEAQNSLGWCSAMILPNLSHFETLTKRCWVLRNRPFQPFCDSQHQTELFLNAQHLFVIESKWLKFGTNIAEYYLKHC